MLYKEFKEDVSYPVIIKDIKHVNGGIGYEFQHEGDTAVGFTIYRDKLTFNTKER